MTTYVSPGKKQAILDAARGLLIARGFQDVALDDVAKEAGVAKGTLFLYYKSKEDLFASAIADLVDRLGAALDSLTASGMAGPELLRETVRTILHHFDLNRDFLSQLGLGRFTACGDRSNKMLVGKCDENNERILRILKACRHDGVLKGSHMQYNTFALMGLCRAAMIEKTLGGTHGPLEKETEKVTRFFLRGAGR